MSKIRYYHASPMRLKKGTILEGTSKPTNVGGRPDSPWMFLTVLDIPHYTIADEAEKENWFVYEVLPMTKPLNGAWDDIICRRVEVVKLVGRARGLMNRYRREHPKDELREVCGGSFVRVQGKLCWRQFQAITNRGGQI